MRTPNTYQIHGKTYTTREYCKTKGITDNDIVLKIQWRINTYTRNHTTQQTIEELERLTLLHTAQKPNHDNQKIIATGITMNPKDNVSTSPQATGSWLNHQRQEKIGGTLTRTTEGTRPWQGTQKERIIAQREKEAREAATSKTKSIDQRELLKQSQWMEHHTENQIENAIHQLAQALRNATRLTKELKETEKTIEQWKEITANLLNAETSNDRFRRHNRPEKNWPDM